MNRINRTLPLSLALLLAGCFAQIEDSSVSLTQPLCPSSTSNCIPGAGQPFSVVKANGTNTVTVPLGDQNFFKPQTDLGPTKLVSKLVLNQATLDMLTAGSDFSGITEMTILSAPRESTGPSDDPCAAGSPPCPVLASYVRGGGPAAGQQLILKGAGADVIALIDQTKHQLVIEVQGKGAAPGSLASPFWNANLTVDMALKARVNFP